MADSYLKTETPLQSLICSVLFLFSSVVESFLSAMTNKSKNMQLSENFKFEQLIRPK